ncbi:MAG: hypothetical protein JRF53_00560 [Deltaproteobacteria bacterium]|nr:hypothetical protein [Deltaproteobacteria bacterium]
MGELFRFKTIATDPPASRPPAIAWHWRAGCEALRAGDTEREIMFVIRDSIVKEKWRKRK